MEIKYLNNMKDGWIAGNFNPVALKADFGEVAIMRYKQYHIESAYCHPAATVLYMLISGSIQLNGKTLRQPYSLATFTPGEPIYFTALADSDVLLFVSGDKTKTRGKDIILDDLLKAYSCFDEYGEDRELSIDPHDISFVIQGAVTDITPVCLESIRRFFPESLIIFSTERRKPVKNLDYDILVESDDVGGIPFKKNSATDDPLCNMNRQLISTANGLKRVETKYAMKLRADSILTGRRFASYQNMYPHRINKMRLFKERVVIGELWTRRVFSYNVDGQQYSVPNLFHPSDCFMFGLTEDLQAYFIDTRTVADEELQVAPLKNEVLRDFNKYGWGWQYATEQFFALEALERKYPGIKKKYRDWSDWSKEAEELSDLFLGNNFIILDLPHHGITMPKHELQLSRINAGDASKIAFFSMRDFEQNYHNIICKECSHERI